MACVPIPKVPIPELPLPLGIGITTPDIEFDPELCCKLLPFPIVLPPISLGLLFNPAVNAIIAANIKIVQDYLDALPLDCPREPFEEDEE